MISNRFKGVGTALVTPFRSDTTVDVETLKLLVERQIQGGVDMLIPAGTTGEAVTLDRREYENIVGTVVAAADKRALVVAGAGTNSTKSTIETARIAEGVGADAVLIVGPYYNKPTQEGFYQHYKAIAEAIHLPIVIYNVPGRTGSNMSAVTQLRLAAIENIVATKEASGNFSQQMEIIAKRPAGFHVLSGDDSTTLAQIAFGMDGVISVVSNEIPEEFAAMVHLALDGKYAEARAIHYKYFELMETNFIESSPIPVKAAMAMMGLLEEAYRLPLVPMQDHNRTFLAEVLRKAALLT
jgi:4-hydroxy-tetrahydrodipicolinate synthase